MEHTFFTCQHVTEICDEFEEKMWLQETFKELYVTSAMVVPNSGFLYRDEGFVLVISFWHIWEARNAIGNGENEMHPLCLVEKKYLQTLLSLNVEIHHQMDGLWLMWMHQCFKKLI